MQKFKAILFFFVFIIACSAPLKQSVVKSETKQNISWDYNLEDTIKLSQQYHKPLFIYFYNDYCEWCDKTNNEVLENKYIKSILNKKFIVLRVNTETSTLSKEIDIKTVPAFVIIDNKYISAKVGYQNVHNMINFLK
jgi:thiol:disulfide interchange protein DsbD